MKIGLNFEKLSRLREDIGAELNRFDFSARALPEFEAIAIRLKQGIEIQIDEVEFRSGLLAYKGQQIVIYIKDHTRRHQVLENAAKGNKFHVRDCEVIQDMKKKKRYARYVATSRTDGNFFIDYAAEYGAPVEEKETKLLPCRVCLRELNYGGYKEGGHRNSIVSNFRIEDFFGLYSTFFQQRPTKTDQNSNLTKYAEDWANISKRFRGSKNWICEECRVNCSDPEKRKYLHAHHINGDVTNNNFNNLKALCALCHSKQPSHGHMSVSSAVRGALLGLRQSQT